MKTVERVLLWSMMMRHLMIMAASHNNCQHHYRAAFLTRPHSGVAHRSSGACSVSSWLVFHGMEKEPRRGNNRGVPTNTYKNMIQMSSGQSDPALELVHGPTNVTVILLGCLHGSSSSALDVERVMMGPAIPASVSVSSDDDDDDDDDSVSILSHHQTQNHPHDPQHRKTDVLVLELCAARFADLQRDMTRRTAARMSSTTATATRRSRTENDDDWRRSMWAYVTMVGRTGREKGWSTGMASALLGGVAGLQSALAGSSAGVEFRVATELAQSQDVSIVLADRTVTDTLSRLGQLGQTSLQMMNDSMKSKSITSTSTSTSTATRGGAHSQEIYHLRTAIWGHESHGIPQVDMGKVLRRNPTVAYDLCRLTLPILIMTQLLTVSAVSAFSNHDPLTTGTNHLVSYISDDSLDNVSSLWSIMGMDMVTSLMTSIVGFVGLVLPATRIVISERDDQLARGIDAACHVAAANAANLSNSNSDPPRVVAVLGLLHVNGVAQRLLKDTIKLK